MYRTIKFKNKKDKMWRHGKFHEWAGLSEYAVAIIEVPSGLMVFISSAYYDLQFTDVEAEDEG